MSLRLLGARRQFEHHVPPRSSVFSQSCGSYQCDVHFFTVGINAVHPPLPRSSFRSATVDVPVQNYIWPSFLVHPYHVSEVCEPSSLHLLDDVHLHAQARSNILVSPSISQCDSTYSPQNCHLKHSQARFVCFF